MIFDYNRYNFSFIFNGCIFFVVSVFLIEKQSIVFYKVNKIIDFFKYSLLMCEVLILFIKEKSWKWNYVKGFNFVFNIF